MEASALEVANAFGKAIFVGFGLVMMLRLLIFLMVVWLKDRAA